MESKQPFYVKMRSADAITMGVYIAFGFLIFSLPFACLFFFLMEVY